MSPSNLQVQGRYLFIQVSFSSFLEDSAFFPNISIIHGLDMGTSTEEIVHHI